MSNKQIIEIEVTWTGWKKLRLNALIAFLAGVNELDIERISVKNKKKR